jgi:hypothetical protein
MDIHDDKTLGSHGHGKDLASLFCHILAQIRIASSQSQTVILQGEE